MHPPNLPGAKCETRVATRTKKGRFGARRPLHGVRTPGAAVAAMRWRTLWRWFLPQCMYTSNLTMVLKYLIDEGCRRGGSGWV
eukprot:1727325-Prymnesium_polylepis.1